MKVCAIIEKISNAIDMLESYICFILLSITVVVGCLQVACRALHAALPWSEELLRFCFIWLTFMGAGLGINAGSHLSVEFFTALMPKKIQHFLSILAMVLVFLFCNQVFLQGINVVRTALSTNMLSPAMRIPMWLPYAGVCIPFCMMQFQVLAVIVRLLFPTKEVKTS